MTLLSALGHGSWSSPMLASTPIVFVFDDDVSVRESLELRVRCEGWQPETFASAQKFLRAGSLADLVRMAARLGLVSPVKG